MQKVLFVFLFVPSLFFSCKPKGADQVEHREEPNTLAMKETHTSKNSLDWEGTYKGILPCADCEGIETNLVLNGNGTYVLQTKYLGKGIEKGIETAGAFAWDTKGNMIALAGIDDGPSMYIVGENQLVQLDMSGNRIEGAVADKYILLKQ